MTSTQAQFKSMTGAEASDWGIIADHMKGFMTELPQRIITHMELLRGDYGGYPVDRLEHSLQTADKASTFQSAQITLQGCSGRVCVAA